MPRYELMYLLGSNVADSEVPQVAEQVKKFITDLGGQDIVENHWGKKKLAYPIGKTRNGYYVVVNFTMDGPKAHQLDQKLRTQDTTIIRYLIVNLEEHLERLEKDRIAQAKLIRKVPAEGAAPKGAETRPAAEVDEKALDEQIEAALSEDVTKS